MTAAVALPAVIAPHRSSSAAGGTSTTLTALPYLEPAPASEPPFDDDLERRSNADPVGLLATGPPGTAQERMPAVGVGTVVAPPPGAPPPRTLSTPGHRTRIAATGVPLWSSESDVGIRRTSTRLLPPATRSGPVFARALIEVLSGRRPLAQLRVHCAPDIYAGLAARPVPPAGALPHLLTVRVCEPADGVAEVSAVFKRAQRVRAIAFRIQGLDGRWRITALEVG